MQLKEYFINLHLDGIEDSELYDDEVFFPALEEASKKLGFELEGEANGEFAEITTIFDVNGHFEPLEIENCEEKYPTKKELVRAILNWFGQIKENLDLNESDKYLEDDEHDQDDEDFEEDESDKLATDKDWDEVLGRLPQEFEFEDLDIEVETEIDDRPTGYDSFTDRIIYTTIPTQFGYIRSWRITVEPTQELIAAYLHKPIEEITAKDLADIDEDDYYRFITEDDDLIKYAIDDALENYEYDDVDWKDPE